MSSIFYTFVKDDAIFCANAIKESEKKIKKWKNALVMIYFTLELSFLATKSFCFLTTLVFFFSMFGNNWTDKITSRMLFSKVFQDVGKMKLLRSDIVS